MGFSSDNSNVYDRLCSEWPYTALIPQNEGHLENMLLVVNYSIQCCSSALCICYMVINKSIPQEFIESSHVYKQETLNKP